MVLQASEDPVIGCGRGSSGVPAAPGALASRREEASDQRSANLPVAVKTILSQMFTILSPVRSKLCETQVR